MTCWDLQHLPQLSRESRTLVQGTSSSLLSHDFCVQSVASLLKSSSSPPVAAFHTLASVGLCDQQILIS